ncbi:asparagine synthase-related protein [Ancylobacter dichloromethanicus]
MSEPMVSYDNIGFYLLSREVSKSIKVVQSGQGADEVFAGYHWYPPLADSNDVVGDYARGFFDRDHATLARQLGPEWMADTDASRDLVAAHLLADGAATPVDRALRLDSQVMLVDDPVKRVDNMTMAWGGWRRGCPSSTMSWWNSPPPFRPPSSSPTAARAR